MEPGAGGRRGGGRGARFHRRDLESLTLGQAARLLVPAVVALLAGPVAAMVVHGARPVADELARSSAGRAAVRAEVPTP
jgi:hypothetical protein